jgi:hypothetical protein
VALMNNTKLLMQSSVNGHVMQTGANRDADGTIDRSPPPTPEVQKVGWQRKNREERWCPSALQLSRLSALLLRRPSLAATCRAQVLFDLKRITDEYGIDMMLEFRTQGATKYGTISKSRFNSILTTTFGQEKGFFWDAQKLGVLNKHYGTGANDLALGGNKLVAWMDVCEDLGETDASFPDNPYKPLKAYAYETHL